MAPKVKLGRFARGVATKRRQNNAIRKNINSKAISQAVGKAITGMTEAQWKRAQMEKNAKGAAARPSVKPLMVALMPHVTVKQPPPYKPSTLKK